MPTRTILFWRARSPHARARGNATDNFSAHLLLLTQLRGDAATKKKCTEETKHPDFEAALIHPMYFFFIFEERFKKKGPPCLTSVDTVVRVRLVKVAYATTTLAKRVLPPHERGFPEGSLMGSLNGGP